MNHIKLLTTFFMLLLGGMTFSVSAATTHIVNAGGNIQNAINTASSSQIDTVLVASGTYVANLSINKNIVLKSMNGAANTVIDGNFNGSVLTISGGSVNGIKISGFTLMNGIGEIRNVHVTGSGALQSRRVGGGVLCEGSSSAVISDMIIENDSAQLGAAVFIFDFSIPIIQNTTIRNSTASQYGGAIWAEDVYNVPTGNFIELNNVIVVNCKGIISGGALGVNYSTKVSVVNCNFLNNVSSNLAMGNGAALWRANNSLINVTNSIIRGNNSTHLVYNDGGTPATGTLAYSNTDYTNVFNNWGTYTLTTNNCINSNPIFNNFSSQNFHLTSDSPCIDAGTSVGVSITDLDGRPRLLGNGVDIGAYEFDATVRDTNLVNVLTILKASNPTKYDYKPDGFGGVYAKYKLVVTYADGVSAMDKDSIRSTCTDIIQYLPSSVSNELEEWILAKDVDEVIQAFGGVAGKSSKRPQRLDKNTFYSEEAMAGVLNFSPLPNMLLPDTNHNSVTLIGLLDTGVDPWHPDLHYVLYRNPTQSDSMGMNFIDDTTPYNICDNHLVTAANIWDGVCINGGHGTHVAGIIAKTANLNQVNNKIKILPIKVLDNNGVGTSYSIVQGILYAVQKGVKAMNLSLGGVGMPDELMYRAMGEANQANILMIVASGNELQNNDNKLFATYPSSFNYTNIIAVQAVDSLSNLWKESIQSNNGDIQIGSNIANNSTACLRSIDLAGYGYQVESIIPSYHVAQNVNIPLIKGKKSGTSMAAAYITAKVVNELKISTPINEIKQNLIRLAAMNVISSIQNVSVSNGVVKENQQSNWYLWNQEEFNTFKYIGHNQIIAPSSIQPQTNGYYQVSNTANIAFEAGKSIILKPGFIAQNTNFYAKIVSIPNIDCPAEIPIFPNRYHFPIWANSDTILYYTQSYSSISKNEIGVRIYPNPFNTETTIDISLLNHETISIDIYNHLGILVDKLWDNMEKEAGNYNFVWNAENLPSGFYLVKIQTKSGINTIEKVILVD